MTNADATHFEEYRPQTRIKHQILAGYLPAYFTALSGSYRSLRYVDGFAGRGTYSDSHGVMQPGSPLLTLRMLSDTPRLSRAVECVFIEARKDHLDNLSLAVDDFCSERPGLPKPTIIHGPFAHEMRRLLEVDEPTSARTVPTFLFVDPCGVDGTAFSLLAQTLRQPGCELFVFFNSAGIERVIGAAKRTGTSKALTDLYGSADRVATLLAALRENSTAAEVEELALAHYTDALKRDGLATHILPYRIEAKHRQDTSHYLIHASKSPVGFRIMKHVMQEMVANHSENDGPLEFRQASAKGVGSKFRFDLVDLRTRVIARLKCGPVQVGEFYYEWVADPADPFSETTYRRLLLSLEHEGVVDVFKDAACCESYPAEKRKRKKAGSQHKETTLGRDRWVKLKP